MNGTSIWRSRPVFITSTFRDMHAERDWLRTHVFPELEERLRARCHHLEPIDLRWGVDTAGVRDESGKEMQVLKVCLAEIERARPFQIVLLGERYGWVPPAERLAAAASAAGFDGDLAGQSITALEIAYGALAQTRRQRCFFYFRAPLDRSVLRPDQLAEYAEPRGSAAEQQLVELKQRIEHVLPGQVHRYGAQWDVAQGRVVGLEDFGRQVLQDLWAVLDAETAGYTTASAQSWQQLERFVLEQFIEERGRGFLGRDAVLQNLVAFATATAGAQRAVCVTAPSGAGKSALFAALQRRLGSEDVLVLAHAAGISTRAGSVDGMLRRWVQELAHVLAVDDPLGPDAGAEEVVRTFQRMLGQASARRRIVLLVDALDQFEATAHAQHLGWLPRHWPDGARLIATTRAGMQAHALARSPFAAVLELAPLDEAAAGGIARAICRRYHRALNDEVLRALMQKRSDDGRPAAGNPLWLSMAVEELNLLDADDFGRAEREFPGSAEQKLLQLLLAVAGSLPADIEGLYDWLLDRAGQLHGAAFVHAFVALVAASRHGWRESDFKRLVHQVSGEEWDDLRWAALRRTLRSHLVARGAFAQWDVHHARFRQAIARRRLADAAARRHLHRLIARYLLGLPAADPLHESETMAHLMQADESAAAAAYYAGELTAGEEAGATAALASAILAPAADEALSWVTALLSAPETTPAQRRELCRRFQFGLHAALRGASLQTQQALLRSVEAALVDLGARFPTAELLQRDLAIARNRLGDLLIEQGDLASAQRAYEDARAATERLAAADPDGTGRQHDLWVSFNKVGDILVRAGNLGKALGEYEKGLAVSERLAAQHPGDLDLARAAAVSHSTIGRTLVELGELAEAARHCAASLAVFKRLADADRASAQRQRDVWVSYHEMGGIFAAQGKLAEALRAYAAGLDVLEEMAARAPGDAYVLIDLSTAHRAMGRVLFAQGKLAEALAACQAGAAICERLAAHDPGHTGWQCDLAESRSSVGDILAAQGRVAAARDLYEEGRGIRQRLTARDPTNARWQADLWVSHTKVGDMLMALGNPTDALREFNAALAVIARAADLDRANADWRRDLSIAHSNVGDALVTQGKLAEALAAYEAAHAILVSLTTRAPDNTSWQRDLALSHARIGDILAAQGRSTDALRAYTNRRSVSELLAAKDASNARWQIDLSVAHRKIGEIRQAQGDLDGALDAYQQGRAIVERLCACEPGNEGWQRDLAVLGDHLGDIMHALGRSSEALRTYEAGLATFEALAAQDLASAERQRDYAVSCFKLATACLNAGQAERSLGHWQRLHLILQHMRRANMHLEPRLAELLQRLDAAVQDRQPGPSSAGEGRAAPADDTQRLIRNTLETRTALRDQVAPLCDAGELDQAYSLLMQLEQLCREANDRGGLSWTLGSQGNILQVRDRFDEALLRYREAEQLCHELTPPSPGWQAMCLANQAELLALKLGRPRDGQVLAEQARRIVQEHGLADLNEPVETLLEQIRAALAAS